MSFIKYSFLLENKFNHILYRRRSSLPKVSSNAQTYLGVVVGKSSKVCFVNIGTKNLVSLTHEESSVAYLDSMSPVRCGDLVELSIMDLKGVGSFSVGSYSRLNRVNWAIWNVLKNRLFVDGVVLNGVASGYSVGIGGWVCFLPRNHSVVENDLDTSSIVGKVQTMKLFSVSNSRRNVVLSRTSVCRRWSWYRSRPRVHLSR